MLPALSNVDPGDETREHHGPCLDQHCGRCSAEAYEALAKFTCPECGEDVWDGPSGSKLAKCWNTAGHADGGTLAFDTMDDLADSDEFECEVCQRVLDIEDSVRAKDGQFVCEDCHQN